MEQERYVKDSRALVKHTPNPRKGHTLLGSARDKKVNKTQPQLPKTGRAMHSGTSAKVKRAPREGDGEIETTKESPLGQGKRKQGIQQGTWDVPMEELTFQLDLERRMGFLVDRGKKRGT